MFVIVETPAEIVLMWDITRYQQSLKKFDKNSENDVHDLKNLVFTLNLDKDKIHKNQEGNYAAFINISMEKIPKMIQNLQEMYKEYQKIKEELQKQGKLELLSTDNKPSLGVENEVTHEQFFGENIRRSPI